ncbi:hypothetical protein BDZ97DRAFT_2067767 [Flammula alnicola]|nr:hypothetical protein BDZ97DRAFT_2067767 [Flammula alnicola]
MTAQACVVLGPHGLRLATTSLSPTASHLLPSPSVAPLTANPWSQQGPMKTDAMRKGARRKQELTNGARCGHRGYWPTPHCSMNTRETKQKPALRPSCRLWPPLPFLRPTKSPRHCNLRPVPKEYQTGRTCGRHRALATFNHKDNPGTCSNMRPTATMNDASNRSSGRILGNKVYITHTTDTPFLEWNRVRGRSLAMPPLPSLMYAQH